MTGPKTIHDAFAAQVRRTPQRVAVSWNAEQITYEDLDRAASDLSRRLLALGLPPEARIGILLPRSQEWISAVMGTLKSGAAYVPLDPAWPSARLTRMCADADLAVILTHKELATRLQREHRRCIHIDEHDGLDGRDDLCVAAVDPSMLAYILFTSGSTGTPKGVMVEHRSVMNLVAGLSQAVYRDLPVAPLRVSVNGPLVFDTSVKQIVQLCMGHTLEIVPEHARLDADAFKAFLHSSGLDVLDCTPTQLTRWIAAGVFDHGQRRPRAVLVGGEPISPKLWAQLLAIDEVAFYNLYGPTECTVDAALCRIEPRRSTPRLGVPLRGTCLHILDAAMRSVEPGAVGELCVSGKGVARGYLDSASSTAARFMPNPFDDGAGTRLYRTGDLARRLPDGEIEFAGRSDRQIKLRGFRIEPGEIESVLARHPAVREAVVVARRGVGEDVRLVAYLTGNRQGGPADEERRRATAVRDYVRSQLPEYMVPAGLVWLPALPLSANGKLDYAALPEVDDLAGTGGEHLFSGTLREQMVASIWREVLGQARIGLHDSFFALGGHSLLVAQVAARLRDRFGCEMPLDRLFDCDTIAAQALLVEQSLTVAKQEFPPIQRAPAAKYYPPSFAQERVWFLQQLAPANVAYLFRTILRFKGRLEISALSRALSEIVRRHEIFRTTFIAVDGRPQQMVHPAWPVHLDPIDLAADPEERERRLSAIAQSEFRAPFDLAALPLVRWKLVRLHDEDHALLHVEHHLIHDGWSLNVFLDELRLLYSAFVRRESSPLPELPIQFRDFCAWQREWTRSSDAGVQLSFWRGRVAGAPAVLDLPSDRPRPPAQTFRGRTHRIELTAPLADRLRQLSRAENVTLFMTMLTGFVALLHKYSAQDDIVVGSAMANRRRRESELLIGMIVNTVMLRTSVAGGPTFRELLQRVRSATLDAYAHQDVPFDAVVEALQPVRDPSHNPLFQVAFSFHDAPLPDLAVPGGHIEVADLLDNGSAKFDLNVICIPRAEQRISRSGGGQTNEISIIWEYNTDLFDSQTIEQMSTHYLRVLEAMVGSAEMHIADCVLLSDDERAQLVRWNSAASEIPSACIHELFDAHARQRPKAIAALDRDGSLTYDMLSRRSDTLARRLRACGAKPGEIVGLCLSRSTDLIVGILAVLKSGAAYLPLDVEHPPARLASIMADARAALLLVDAVTASRVTKVPASIVHVDEGCDATPDASAPGRGATPRDVAYVIYTSGTTGAPKGVAVTHRSLTNVLFAMQRLLGMTAADRVFALSSVCFDIAAFELLAPLSVGASCWIATDRTVAGSEIVNEFRSSGSNILQTTPSAWRVLLEQGWRGNGQDIVLSAGEPLPPSLAEALRRSGTVWNLYGPTETTIYSTAQTVQSGGGTVVPIGSPLANTRVFVLDRRLQEVPIGVFGELFIAGAGVALGYLSRAALTAWSFVPDPFSGEPGARLYRTGDIVRFRFDGALEFAGRRDHQIKLRGFRIELAEVESVLATHAMVRQAVVTLRGQSSRHQVLVAYVIPADPVSPDERLARAADLRDYAKDRLPDYMVPATVVWMESLPMTANGKLDRSMLPEPDPGDQRSFVAPTTVVEQTLAEIWCEVLGCRDVSAQDNFFDLGGNSLSAMQVASRTQRALGVDMPLLLAFDHPVLSELARALHALAPRGCDPAPNVTPC